MGTNYQSSKIETVTDEQLGKGVMFRRVRRITGYLSDESSFNNAKQAELHDRVSHASVVS